MRSHNSFAISVTTKYRIYFLYSQLLLGISKNNAGFATTGTPAKFWSVWKENVDAPLKKVLAKPAKKMADTKWLLSRFNYVSEEQANYFTGPRAITNQDRALYSLCRPERVLELAFSYTIFDAGDKKGCPLPAVLHCEKHA